MFRKQTRVIAAVVMYFFTWSSGGICSLAHAAKLEANKPKAAAVPQKQKPANVEERFSKITEDLENSLADTKTDNISKTARLKAGRDEIDKLDIELRAQFAVTEQKLKAAKLSPAILERHRKFVKHYDDNLNELLGNVARVEKAKDSTETETELQKVHQHLKRVKAPSSHQKLDPNNMPNRKRAIVWREPRTKKEEFAKDVKKDKQAWKSQQRIMVAANGSLAGLLTSSSFNAITLPAADDLAETTEVQFTPEIRAKASELGNNPVKIYEWVRNNFKFEPYYGSLKGAQQTFLEKSGNDLDQASLLIALLRSANIPTKYVYGTIELPAERVMAWLGVKDAKIAGDIIASGSIPGKAILDSSGKIVTIRLEHVWVEAFVNMYPSFGAKPGAGNAWTPIDPSFKEQELSTSVDISKIVKFNETEYLSKQNTISPSLSYLQTLDNYHSANYQGPKNEMYYLKRIKLHEFGIFMGTLPYRTVVVGSKFSSIDTSLRHKMTITLNGPQTNTTMEVTKNICDLAGKKITVSYTPANPEDIDTVANYGGLLHTPANLIHVKAVVRVDDIVVLEGPEIGMGQPLKLRATFTGQGRPDEFMETDMSAGIYYNIGLSALNVADSHASAALDNSNNLVTTFFNSINNGDNQTGIVLNNIALQYFTHTNNDSKVLEGVMQIHNTRSANAGFVSVTAKYTYTLGAPSSPPIIAGLLMDLRRFIQSPFSITGDADQEREFTKIQGLSTSFYEHAIWESFSGFDSVSTVKLLQLANEAGTPIYTINSANINATLPLLNQAQAVKTDIQNVVAAGRVVTIPGSAITRNEWHGTGYMARNPDTGEGAYIISNGYAGGATTHPLSALGLMTRTYAALALGQPANQLALNEGMWNWLGGEYNEITMYYISEMLLARGFIPRCERTFSKDKLLNLINRPDNWIVYYSGHGASSSASGDVLAPGYNPDGSLQYVYPSDIETNARIVFLNGCHSGERGSFMNSFGLDNQIFMGWYHAVDYYSAGDFAFDWWGNFQKGITAAVSAGYVDGGRYVTPSSDPEKPYIVIKGGALTLNSLH